MNTRWIVYVVFTAIGCGLLSPMSTAMAEDAEWMKLSDEGRSLYRQGQYDRATEVTKKALEIAEQAGDPNALSVATSLNDLATL